MFSNIYKISQKITLLFPTLFLDTYIPASKKKLTYWDYYTKRIFCTVRKTVLESKPK